MTAIIVMAKRPELGKCKTRLAQGIGDQQALNVYRLLLANTLDQVEASSLPVFLFLTGEGIMEFPENFAIRDQGNGDLGDRMKDAFDHVFEQGFQNAIMIGTDCYELSSQHIAEAKKHLENVADVVLGPSEDGGYYLIGMNGMHDLFDGIAWSTPQVFTQSLEKIDQLGLTLATLEELNDIDTLEDLRRSTLRPNLPGLIGDI